MWFGYLVLKIERLRFVLVVGFWLASIVKIDLLMLQNYFFRMVINFSIIFNRQLNNPRRGPIALSISRRMFMSVWLMVFVSIATIKKMETILCTIIVRY